MSNKKKLLFFSVGAAIFLVLLLWTIRSNTALELNRYAVSSEHLPEAFDGFRIAHVSDLHNAEIGPNNQKLLAILREAQPDMIAITGDLIDSRNTNLETALDFVQAAMEIAPCYYVTGNHESRIPAYASLKEGLCKLGVLVLEDEKTQLERSGQSLTLLGIHDPAFAPAAVPEILTAAKLENMTETDSGFTLLLSHRPELFDIYADAGIDLVLSGHAHGGQFRLPLVGGLFAPGQGFFPRYDSGIYTRGRTCMAVSRGIGNSIIPLRFNNPPEVILTELKCQ